MEDNLLENDRKRYADDITVQELVRLRVENERLRGALRDVMDDLELISKNHWLPVGMLDDHIYVTARATLQQKESE